ncbi:glycosyltransferase [Flavihumibacter profundi]|uniref:glycosyltransferase n=1 Tax=Flavihumibacter profundi TaxID=2716883 RepID=UPI001CC5F294|nr:glycosyltransferase [Flavihumibacter profundi]MBZ5858951.1 glycosyltransferase [Flavihumibacter profundi]
MILVYTITSILLTTYAVLLGYYHRSFKQIPEDEIVPVDFVPQTRISVLVPARNEEHNISYCIGSLLAQNYPANLLQFIIIDDHSEDATAQIVKNYKNPKLVLLSLEEHLPAEAINAYKKKAIDTGIEHANGELIVTTDADCIAPPFWLRNIAYTYESKDSCFIAGPVKMELQQGWLTKFQALDFLSLQGITAASVYKGFHSMCNGANLAYSRSAFHSVNGFRGIDAIASGDDMLLMYKIAQQFPGKITYLKNRAAIVTTEPAPSLKTFLHQRIRWASKAQAYEDKSVFRVLLLVYIMNLLMLTILITGFLSLQQLAWALLLLAIKTGIEWPFMHSVANFYGQGKLMKYFPFYQPLHIIYTVVAGSFGQFGSYEWKGRQVR